ncbi:MAG: protein kinase [Oscillospiraceae bacterium]
MSTGRITEIMEEHCNITQIMDGKFVENNENIETNATAFSVNLSENSIIDGYLIKSVINENTGEASIILAEKGNTEYVIKMFHKNKIPKKELVDVISKINCEYIVKPIEFGVFQGRYYEVLPYFKHNDLLSSLPISYNELEKIIIPCINMGINALHNVGIVHRDIKPGNIFYSNNKKTVIIGDFGISSVLKNDVTIRVTTASRTLGYAAPETSLGFISKESDYYSFGITLLHLVLGRDPFENMTEMQILFQTINKKLEIPQSVDLRLSRLIRGLTLKERSERWGYKEVCKWLENDEQKLPEENCKINTKLCEFCGEKYSDKVMLSAAMSNNWEFAKECLYDGTFYENFSAYDKPLAAECERLVQLENPDKSLFSLIYAVNPQAVLCYKGKFFKNVEMIGQTMSENPTKIVPEIAEMASSGCLNLYLKINQYDVELINQVEKIENLMNQDNKYYFALMYLLNPKIGYMCDDKAFLTFEGLIKYLLKLPDDLLEKACETLVDDENFHMWIYAQGYSEQLLQWIDLYEKSKWKETKEEF